MSNIINRLGTEAVPRLRIGIGETPENWEGADFVLSKFSASEREEMNRTVSRAADGVADWTRHGLDYCMNQYNAS